MRDLMSKKPDITLSELRDAVGLNCTLPAIHYALEQIGLSYKKALYASEQEREDVAKARTKWFRQQGKIDPSRLVFLDESVAQNNMTRARGRCERRKRVKCTK